MKGEIIVIGNELVSGKIPDTDGCYATRKLTLAGFHITGITVVGDNPESIESSLRSALKRSDFVVITGGLGPTSDDITAEVAAKILGRPLVLNTDILSRLETCLQGLGIVMTPEHRKIALIPQGSEVIDSEQHVCGFTIVHHEKPLFFLPGVPEEMESLLDTYVIPSLLERAPKKSYVEEHTLKIFGLEESEVDRLCQGIGKDQEGVTLSFLPKFPECHVIVTVRRGSHREAEDVLEEIERAIRERLGIHVIGKDGETLEGIMGDLLRSKGFTLSLAESCTGGLIGYRITNISGSSDYLTCGVIAYSNCSKQELLKIPKEILEDYGAVSGETAEWMAKSIRINSGTDLGLSVTGIAGPTGGTKDKPVGTVYVGMSTTKATVAKVFKFVGNRKMIRLIASQTALDWVRRYLIDDTFLFSY